MKMQMFTLLAIVVVLFIACDNDSSTGNDNSSDDSLAVEKLSFFEEELLGLWSRYHGYDGSTKYIRFNGDRTACDWEEEKGSNYRKSKSSFSNWYVDEENPIQQGRFKVIIEGAGIYYTFDYPSNTLWPQTYTNLKYTPSTEGKICE